MILCLIALSFRLEKHYSVLLTVNSVIPNGCPPFILT